MWRGRGGHGLGRASIDGPLWSARNHPLGEDAPSQCHWDLEGTDPTRCSLLKHWPTKGRSSWGCRGKQCYSTLSASAPTGQLQTPSTYWAVTMASAVEWPQIRLVNTKNHLTDSWLTSRLRECWQYTSKDSVYGTHMQTFDGMGCCKKGGVSSESWVWGCDCTDCTGLQVVVGWLLAGHLSSSTAPNNFLAWRIAKEVGTWDTVSRPSSTSYALFFGLCGMRCWVFQSEPGG